jgi:hypothetical protein
MHSKRILIVAALAALALLAVLIQAAAAQSGVSPITLNVIVDPAAVAPHEPAKVSVYALHANGTPAVDVTIALSASGGRLGMTDYVTSSYYNPAKGEYVYFNYLNTTFTASEEGQYTITARADRDGFGTATRNVVVLVAKAGSLPPATATPTAAPTAGPTLAPTPVPTQAPTLKPTEVPIVTVPPPAPAMPNYTLLALAGGAICLAVLGMAALVIAIIVLRGRKRKPGPPAKAKPELAPPPKAKPELAPPPSKLLPPAAGERKSEPPAPATPPAQPPPERYCMHCGTGMSLEAAECPKCGKTPPSGVDTRECPACSTVIPEAAQFCYRCGLKQPKK